MQRSRSWLRLDIGSISVHRATPEDVRRHVGERLDARTGGALAIGSVNLDHIHHFWAARRPRCASSAPDGGSAALRWWLLVDGAPVARRARAVTGVVWPRLTGADLLPDLLDLAEQHGARVGFLGGAADTAAALRRTVATRWPRLTVAGVWTPPREVVDSPAESASLALDIAAAHVDVLVVGLGKPRQERWIEAYGDRTEACLLLAFGAAADFLAGSARRAPAWMRRAGIEWLFRLLQEPRRLSRRYLVEGPHSWWTLRRARAVATYTAQRAELLAVVPEDEDALHDMLDREADAGSAISGGGSAQRAPAP